MKPRHGPYGWLFAVLFVIGLPLLLRADDGPPTTVEVRADGKGDFATIQAAIDAVAPGGTILLGEGTFDENLVVTKPLTLRGLGFGATRLTSLLFKRCDLNAVNRSMMAQLRRARTETERQRVWARIQTKRAAMIRPTVRIKDTDRVVLEGLRLSGRAEREEGVVNPGVVVAFENARGAIRHCAVLGSPGRGIAVRRGSDVDIERCLVAAIWATGIEVGEEDGPPAKARIHACDVRRCVHRGITVAPGCDDVRIEDCRISLSAWHGVRYDDASPTLRRNVIAGNQRSGIYASGTTQAVVEQNLILGNAGEGMSCWFQNHDAIRRNTFAGNDVVAIGLAGGSRPLVEENVFYRSFVAIDGLHLSVEPMATTSPLPFPIRGNVWFKCARLTRAAMRAEAEGSETYDDLPLTPDADNRQANPGFADAEASDYHLPADATAGAAGYAPVESPWPVQAEEASMKEAWGDGCAAAGH